MDQPSMLDCLQAAINQVKQQDRTPHVLIGYVDARKIFDRITGLPKWYHAFGIDRHHASRIMKKHIAGTYTNYKWFFERCKCGKIDVWYPMPENEFIIK